MASDLIKHVSDASFQSDVLDAKAPVLVDLWAEWCGPCKMIAPILDEVAGAYDGKLQVAKLNVDDHGDIAGQFNVMSIPTMILFDNGVEKHRIVGAKPKSAMVQELAGFLPSSR